MILVVTAVDAERDALLRGVNEVPRPGLDKAPSPGVATRAAPAGVEVVTVGVGPAAAAAGAAWHLARAAHPVSLVVCAGIAGGFGPRARMGDVVVATRTVAADLGADQPDGFIPLDELGFGVTSRPATELPVPGAIRGTVVTVSTVTGTVAGSAALAARYPDVVAEGMEGFGVACAAALAGVAFAEVRTISNIVGPRDRTAWRIGAALEALEPVGACLATVESTLATFEP